MRWSGDWHMPEVSIIMPTFNSEPYVEESVLSVIAQREPDFELILVDDGSTDQTAAVVNRLASNDRRLVVPPAVPTGSAGAARNRGLACAQGKYVAFLDDDDLLHPDKISRAMSVFRLLPEADIVFHDYVSFTEDPNGKEGDLTQARFTARAAEHLKAVGPNTYQCGGRFYAFMSTQVIPFHTSALMFRRALLDSGALRFRQDLRIGQDIELWLRLARHSHIAFLDQVLSYYRQRPGSLTSNPIGRLRDSIQVHTENLQRGRDVFTSQETKVCQSKLAGKFFDLGYAHFCRGERREARIAYRKSMHTDFSIRAFAAYLKTYSPNVIVRMHRRSPTNGSGGPPVSS